MAKTILFKYNPPADSSVFSNFYPSPFEQEVDGEMILFQTMEHYFQFHKTKDKERRQKILSAWSPKDAKYQGSERAGTPMRKNWDEVKDKVMYAGLLMKYRQNPILAKRLIATGKAILAHDAPWDEYWGTGKEGKGEDKLGALTMKVRAKLAKEMGEEE